MAGRKSKAKALWTDAKRHTAKAASEVAAKADERTAGKATDAIDGAAKAVKGAVSKTQGAATAAVEKGAETDRGASALSATKDGLRAMAGLPVLSLIGDGLQARQGVPQLMELVRENPYDPMPPIWLAEALLRVGVEQRGVDAGRAVINPFRLPLLVAAKAVNEANQDQPAVPVITRLLVRGYVLALARLGDGPSPHDLHALSRVYLARGAPAEAVRLAQGAIAVGGDETAEAAVTLARAQARRGSIDLAWSAADLAVVSGSTVGYQVMAELPDRGSTTPDVPVDSDALSNDDRAVLLAKVRSADVARYRGADPSAGEMMSGLLERQRDRTKAQVPKIRAMGERLRGTGDDRV